MKKLKISTELASAVLDKEVTKCSLISTIRNSINITYFEDKEDFNTVRKEWNIYEFAFKCKEWACGKDFILISYKKPYEAVKKKGYCQTHHIHDKTREKDKPFICDFEHEAIIKACEWILSEVNR